MESKYQCKDQGSYSAVKDVSVSGNKFGFIYQEEGKWKAKINNKVFGPYENIDNLSVFESNFGFSYQDQGKMFFTVNPVK
jgi:hypothetical protein